MSLADLDAVKTVLRIPTSNTDDDVFLQAALDAAEAEVYEYLGLTSSYDEDVVFAADVPFEFCVDRICLGSRPVASVSEVKTADEVIDPDVYRVENNWIILCPSEYTATNGGIVVRYFEGGCNGFEATATVGWSSVPAHVERAVAVYAAKLYASDPTDSGLKSVAVGRYRRTMFAPSELAHNMPTSWPAVLVNALQKYQTPMGDPICAQRS